MQPCVEEFEMPCVEALLAGTLALMTGYGQALQADLNPQHRLAMNIKIARNLDQLAQQASLSDSFRVLLGRLRECWQAMVRCTVEAGFDDTAPAPDGCAGGASRGRMH